MRAYLIGGLRRLNSESVAWYVNFREALRSRPTQMSRVLDELP
jgi:hypothetical protein